MILVDSVLPIARTVLCSVAEVAFNQIQRSASNSIIVKFVEKNCVFDGVKCLGKIKKSCRSGVSRVEMCVGVTKKGAQCICC